MNMFLIYFLQIDFAVRCLYFVYKTIRRIVKAIIATNKASREPLQQSDYLKELEKTWANIQPKKES